MFEITILSLQFNQSLTSPYTIQIRSISSSRIQNQSSLCSGKHFQWNQKFYCSEFQIIHVVSLNKKQRIGLAIYDFLNSNQDIVTGNERKIKVFDGENRIIGRLTIQLRYVQGDRLLELKKLIPSSVTFGNSPQNKNNNQLNIDQWSTAHKSQNNLGVSQYQTKQVITTHIIPFGSHTPNIYQQSNVIRIQPLVIQGTSTPNQQINYQHSQFRVQNPISFFKSQDKFKNLFSCFDNCHQQFQLAPALIRN